MIMEILIISIKYSYKYSNNGDRTELFYYHYDGSLKSRSEYKYDDSGDNIETNDYYSNGNLKTKTLTTFKYSDYGDNTESFNYHNDGTLDLRKVFIINNDGDMLGTISYNRDGDCIDFTEY